MSTDLLEAAKALAESPARVLLPRTAASRFALAKKLQAEHRLQVAYSIKTNPDRQLMRLAGDHGLLAETISPGEIEWAIECGWSSDRIIHNGPVPYSRADREGRCILATFADDLTGLSACLESPVADVIGVRLRHPGMTSRFGVPLEDPAGFDQLVDLFANAPAACSLGVSFHLASSEVGMGRWSRCATDIIEWADLLGELSARSIKVLDLGGGWAPEDFEAAVASDIPRLAQVARMRLGEEVEIIVEPGKALAQPAMALLTRIVHLRKNSDGSRELVVDAGLCDMPQARTYPHRVVWMGRQGARVLGPGPDTILGRSCMEADCLAEGVALPDEVAVGDVLAICDCGGYDASMAYSFARGGFDGPP